MAETILVICKCAAAISLAGLVVIGCLTGILGFIKLMARMADVDIDTPKEQGWKDSWSDRKKK